MDLEIFNEYYKKLAASDYEAYLLHTNKNYKLYRHIKVIAKYLQEIADWWKHYESTNGNPILPKPKNLIINTPPQVGKSMSIVETFPSFILGNFPDYKVITTAYGGGLVARFGAKNLQKFSYFAKELWGLEVDPKNSAKTTWQVKGHEGRMVSAGIMGGLTGESANLLVVDDPYKNRQDAESKAIRERVWEEWNDTLKTRVNPKNGIVIIVHTRWKSDDLTGRLMETEPNNWNIVRIPAECDSEDDPMGRTIGEPICPEMGRDERWIAETKIAQGSRGWNSLYQQNPTPSDGTIFKREWFKFYDILPQVEAKWISMDATFSGSDNSDYVVMQLWAKKGAEFFLIDQVRSRMDFTTTTNTFRAFCAKYPEARLKLIEQKANGHAIINTLNKEIGGIIPVNPKESKESRAQAITPLMEAGNIYFPRTPWIHDFIEECIVFPNGSHDDQIDSMTQAINYVYNQAKAKKGVSATIL